MYTLRRPFRLRRYSWSLPIPPLVEYHRYRDETAAVVIEVDWKNSEKTLMKLSTHDTDRPALVFSDATLDEERLLETERTIRRNALPTQIHPASSLLEVCE